MVTGEEMKNTELFKMIDKGFIPYEGSLHPKVQAIHEKSITGCSDSSC